MTPLQNAILLCLGIVLLVGGSGLYSRAKRTLDIGEAVAAQWFIGLSILPFMLLLAEFLRV